MPDHAGRLTLTVAAAKTLAGGKKLNVGLTLPTAAYKKLKGKTATVTLKVSATATGASTTTLAVKAPSSGNQSRRTASRRSRAPAIASRIGPSSKRATSSAMKPSITRRLECAASSPRERR